MVIVALEAINILLVDCDGTVVPGALSLGQTELLEYATTGPWNITVDIPWDRLAHLSAAQTRSTRSPTPS